MNANRDALTTTGFRQNWSLDGLGNWGGFKVDAVGDGTTWTLDQTRHHNLANEVDTDQDHTNGPDEAAITEGQGQAAWVGAKYSAVGNMTQAPKPGDETTRLHLQYDAWNRLVKVSGDSGASAGPTLAEFRYDGTGRRIRKYTDPTGETTTWTVREYYFNNAWQNLEVRKDSGKTRSETPAEADLATTLYEQYVWSARYVNAPVCRDRDADGNAATGDYGGDGNPDNGVTGLEEHLFYTTDGNSNITVLVGTDGAVVERYVYDSYGKATFYTGAWTLTQVTGQANGTASAYSNEILYCGCSGPSRVGLASVGCDAACGSGFAGPFEPSVGAGHVLERQLGALGNEDVGIGAYGGRGVSQVAPTQQRQATRRSLTTGRCLCPCSNVTTSSRRATLRTVRGPRTKP